MVPKTAMLANMVGRIRLSAVSLVSIGPALLALFLALRKSSSQSLSADGDAHRCHMSLRRALPSASLESLLQICRFRLY